MFFGPGLLLMLLLLLLLLLLQMVPLLQHPKLLGVSLL